MAKKENFIAFFRTLFYSCQMTADIQACRSYLTQCQRSPTFIQLFDSVYSHYCHLQALKEKTEVQRTIEELVIQITPFLLSEVTAKVFTAWAEEYSYSGETIDTDLIISIIGKLEKLAECRLTEPRTQDHQIEIFLILCREHKKDLLAKLMVKKEN